MQHYFLFGLRVFGFVFGVIVLVVVGAAGVNLVGTAQHYDVGTAAKVSGGAAGIVNWHDRLVVAVNKEVQSESEPYKSAFAYGSNSYTFFDQNQECPIGQGFVVSNGLLESKTYYGAVLLQRIRTGLTADGYRFTESVKRGSEDDTHILLVQGGAYYTKIEVKVSAKNPRNLLGNWVTVLTARTDKQDPCYPMKTLPAPQGQYR